MVLFYLQTYKNVGENEGLNQETESFSRFLLFPRVSFSLVCDLKEEVVRGNWHQKLLLSHKADKSVLSVVVF